jgi:hypothetical protein
MSTRAFIAYFGKDRSLSGTFLGSDGYPEHVMPILQAQTPQEVWGMIQEGEIRSMALRRFVAKSGILTPAERKALTSSHSGIWVKHCPDPAPAMSFGDPEALEKWLLQDFRAEYLYVVHSDGRITWKMLER